MNSKYLIYVCTRMCMSVPRVDNRATNTGESVNTQLFAWVGVSLCVHRQNGSIFYNLMYSVCVCGACVCMCESNRDPLTWQLFLRECTHPCHYHLTHCWLTAFSTAPDCQSVTLLISSQSQHTSVVLTAKTDHWWYMAFMTTPSLYFTTLLSDLWDF